jgi:DNA-binding PadR family transcriptional regulator
MALPEGTESGLTTTAYAVLGMLAVRDWTGYELTQQMRRGLAHCWPKNDSVLYDEPRRLVQRGLAAVAVEPAGRRTRRRYAITPAGQQALAAWLATRPADPKLEIEAMLRLLYADSGSVDDLLKAIGALRDWAYARYVAGRTQVIEYRQPEGAFPQRRHIQALFARFFASIYHTVIDWCGLTAAEVSRWDSTTGRSLDQHTLALLDEMLAIPIPVSRSDSAHQTTHRHPGDTLPPSAAR